MALLFNRTASLTVGKEGAAGVKLLNNRIAFAIEKTSESNANTAKISIYNLNPTHRQQFESKDLVMILEAGYEGFDNDRLEGVLFQGDIAFGKTQTVKNGPDYITTVEAGDGEKALRQDHFEKSYGAGTFLSSVINDLKKAINVADGIIEDIGKEQLVNGGAFSGKVKDILDVITKRMGLEWSIQNKELHIRKPKTTKNNLAIVLNSSTGLVSLPIKREEGVGGIAFLNPKIQPGATVKIESEAIIDEKAFYRVRKCNYFGDTHGSHWFVRFEAVQGVN
jgi:hypothetical protein